MPPRSSSAKPRPSRPQPHLAWRQPMSRELLREPEVELLLQPDQGTTCLLLRHGPLQSKAQVETYRRTWKSTLDSLVLKLSEEGADN